MVDEGKTGMNFNYADLEDFRKKITYMMEHPEETKKMGENGYKLIETKYSPETHYKALMEVFNQVLKNNIEN